MEAGTRLIRRDEPLTAVVDGETVMFSPDQGAYFGLDPIGSRVWDLLSEPRSIEELCAILGDEYDVDPDTCRTDVGVLIDELREANLVRDAA
ncbi:MAG TPA: PqqD family peptide modification chaperone [Thermoleophilaceae bacterium]|nr:PqqD family peptide modification chaperone [Thermoleophilaceae bacterium]